MNKIVTTEEAIKLSEDLRNNGKNLVLAGGCFDILHIGHITFLKEAQKQGDLLFVLVEDDATIKKLKGNNRPLNSQDDRAEILSHLDIVDYVIKLDPKADNNFYDQLVMQLKPAIIATTAGDLNRIHKERQAKLIGAKVVDVTAPIKNQSTTRLIHVLNEL